MMYKLKKILEELVCVNLLLISIMFVCRFVGM